MLTECTFAGIPNCLRLANQDVELFVPTDRGPRILGYSYIGQESVLGLWPDLVTHTTWGDWKPWGGHRLWVAPESMPRSYAPDDHPISHVSHGEYSLVLNQSVDRSGIEKQIGITLALAGSTVSLVHTLANRTEREIEIAPWALTIMRPGGEVFVPVEPFRSHDEELLPSQPMVRWYFTDFTDRRWILGRRFIRLRTDASLQEPQKAGLLNRQGWCAYLHGSSAFLKTIQFEAAANYPDFGCNTEFYTAGEFIELESLGPMTRLQPGGSLQHVEQWCLLKDFDRHDDEDALFASLQSAAQRLRGEINR